MNDDLRLARQVLQQDGCTCVLCKDGHAKTCTARGVRPLVELLDSGHWNGYWAADKVVGKATAFLYVLLGISGVCTPVASEAAAQILKRYGIPLYADQIVPAILNRNRSGFCPMETAVRDIADPAEALCAIRNTMQKLRAGEISIS